MLTKLGYARAEFPIITRPSASNIALQPLEFGGVLRDEPTRKVFFGMTITPWDEVLSRLSPVQTDARLLASNSQLCWMLHVASFCTPCCMLLRKVWNQSNFFCWHFEQFIFMSQMYSLGGEASGASIAGLILWADTACRSLKKSGSNSPRLAVLTRNKL